MPDPGGEMLLAGLLDRSRPRLAALRAAFRVAPQDFEDLVQESLLALWRKRHQVENPEAWLMRALRLECLRHQRRESRKRQTTVDRAELEILAGPESGAGADPGLFFDLHRLVRRLPPRQRALIRLRFELGLTAEEAARKLGYKPASLKKTTTRCLHVLRRGLDEGGLM